MIKDISIIRKELDGYEEVILPFEFTNGSLIKYITLRKKNKDEEEEESFYTGGKYAGMGNDCIILKKDHRTWNVACCKRNKDGSIRYSTRFFVKSEDEECDKRIKELNDVTKYQQNIINKLTEKLKELELIKYQITEEKKNYEDLLQQNRFNLKKLSIQLREKDEKIKKYEEVIKKLANSHQMFK